MESEDSK
jgi:hypothetical protein